MGSSTVYGSVRWFPWLDYDPNPQQKSSLGMPVFAYNKDSDLPEDLQLANFEQNIAEHKSSADKFKNHFTINKASKYNVLASVQYIKSLSYYLTLKEVIAEIEKTLSENQSEMVQYELLSGLAGKLSIIGQSENATKKLDEALKLNLEKEKQDRILSQKAIIYCYDLNEIEKGKSIFEEILKSNTNESPWHELASTELETLNGKESFLPKQNVVNNVEEVPIEYELVGNYPNPFNPSTKIKYGLPFTSEVKLTFYDIMGREVRSFELNSQIAGSHELEWNGTNNNGSLVSSGIYLLHFNATSVDNNKSYNKTAKLMLVK